jgi:hypothetical protein
MEKTAKSYGSSARRTYIAASLLGYRNTLGRELIIALFMENVALFALRQLPTAPFS